jgi:hypothetical protein
MVKVCGGSTNMPMQKVARHTNIQMEESTITIISARIIITTVTELKHTMVEQNIEESSKMARKTVMDS